jgi:hypothetical protein
MFFDDFYDFQRGFVLTADYDGRERASRQLYEFTLVKLGWTFQLSCDDPEFPFVIPGTHCVANHRLLVCRTSSEPSRGVRRSG